MQTISQAAQAKAIFTNDMYHYFLIFLWFKLFHLFIYYLTTSLVIYSSTIYFHLHPFLFNLSIFSSCLLFSLRCWKYFLARSNHRSINASLVCNNNSNDQPFCVNKSRKHLLISAHVLMRSYNRITNLSITWKSSSGKVPVEPNLIN